MRSNNDAMRCDAQDSYIQRCVSSANHRLRRSPTATTNSIPISFSKPLTSVLILHHLCCAYLALSRTSLCPLSLPSLSLVCVRSCVRVCQMLVDNPDQRINDDVRVFTATALAFSLAVFNATVDLISFSGILYSIYPPLFATLIAYSLGGTAISVALGKVRLAGRQGGREAGRQRHGEA